MFKLDYEYQCSEKENRLQILLYSVNSVFDFFSFLIGSSSI